MSIWVVFKKRKIGPLSASPVGLILLCIVVGFTIIRGYGAMRDRAIADEFSEAIHYAEPIAAKARWIYEQTGEWPSSPNDPRLDMKPNSMRTFQLQFLREQGVRVALDSGTTGANSSVTLRVTANGDGRYLSCESAGLAPELVPRSCRDMKNRRIGTWPP